TRGGKAANELRPEEEMVEHAHALVDPCDVSRLQMQQPNHVRHDFVVGTNITGRAKELHVAADAGEILLEDGERAAGRVAVVVKRIVAEVIPNQRGKDGAVCQFLAHGQGSLAVRKTI